MTLCLLSISQLVDQDARVFVRVPEDSQDRVRDAQIQLLQQQVQDLQSGAETCNKFVSTLQKIAVRALLDEARNKIKEIAPTTADKTNWNTFIENLPESTVQQVGVALNLTKYGAGTDQAKGNKAAHEVDIEMVKCAVLSKSASEQPHYQQLFKLVYGEEAKLEE